jgi:hypothetical protein
MSDSSNAKSQQNNLIIARRYLRELQMTNAPNEGIFTFDQADNMEQTIQALRLQRQFTKTDDPAVVRRGIFKFDREKETKRISRAEELIRRVDPGPFEDPTFLALLAYQAASVELVLLDLLVQKKAQERLSKILLGTVHRAKVDASAYILTKRGYTIIALNSGLVDFIYQAAKAVIEALNPARPANGGSAVAHTTDLGVISDGLRTNAAPIDRVWKILESYFFKGYPRVYWNETVNEEHGPPLSILISMAERWVIAHEYGHNLADYLTTRAVNDQDIAGKRGAGLQNPHWTEEFLADTLATINTVQSAAYLDGLPPESSLSGGSFALACADILEKSLAILRTGDVSKVEKSKTHPPCRTRAEANIAAFNRYFDVEYTGTRTSDLSFRSEQEMPNLHPFSSERSQVALLPANVLLKIWNGIKDILMNQFLQKRPLHPMWR